MLNQHKSAERKIAQKNTEYMNFSMPYRCSKNLSSFWLIIKQPYKKFLFLVTAAILNIGWSCQMQFWKGDPPMTIPFKLGFIWSSGVRRFKCESLRCTTDRLTTDTKWWQKLTWPLGQVNWKNPLKADFYLPRSILQIHLVISGKKHAILFYFLLGDKCMPIKLICILIHNTREI
jgi:hypothetical protein